MDYVLDHKNAIIFENDSRRFYAVSEDRCLEMLERLNMHGARFQVEIRWMTKRLDVSKAQLRKYVKSLKWKARNIQAEFDVRLRNEECNIDVIVRFEEGR